MSRQSRKIALPASFLFTALFFSLFNAPAFAQLDTASISGRITDPTGAVIPNANVTVVNTDTNFQYESVTNPEGLFRVPSLRPGPYRLEVKAPGFKTYQRFGLDLEVGGNLSLDTTLEVGGASETISVTGEASQLQTETSSSGMVAEGTYLQGLPLYQRNVKATFYLMPNVDVAGFGYSGNLRGIGDRRIPELPPAEAIDGEDALIVGFEKEPVARDRGAAVRPGVL